MSPNYFFTKSYELSKFGVIFARPGSQRQVTIRASSNPEHYLLHFQKALECSFQRVFLDFFYHNQIKNNHQEKRKIPFCCAKYGSCGIRTSDGRSTIQFLKIFSVFFKIVQTGSEPVIFRVLLIFQLRSCSKLVKNRIDLRVSL